MKTATLLIKGRNNVLSKCKQVLFQCQNYLRNSGLRDQSRHVQVRKSCLVFEWEILADIKLSGQRFWAGFSSRDGGLLTRYGKKWVSSTSAPLSWMQVEAPLPDASHISGTGLEGDKAVRVTSVLAEVNLSSALSPLSCPNLSSPVSNVDTTTPTPVAHGPTGPHEFLHSVLVDV